MDFLKDCFKRDDLRRIIVLALLGGLLYLMKEMINLFLFTFIFTYLMYRIQDILNKFLKRFVRIQQRIMIVFLYLLLIGGIVITLVNYGPRIISQAHGLSKDLKIMYDYMPLDNPTIKFAKIKVEELTKANMSDYTQRGVDIIVKSTSNIVTVLISLILSLFFLLEKNRIKNFTKRFGDSKVCLIYNEIEYFGVKFLNSFGKVIEAQVLIAFTNASLSLIALTALGFNRYVLGLGLMIFVLGLIPVAGVIISLVPLSLVAYNVGSVTGPEGGVRLIIYVLIMIAVLHAIETYFLNPKFMSYKTKLPVFFTLMILIISERLMGVWGLIIGIPIFTFILDLLEVNLSGNDECQEND